MFLFSRRTTLANSGIFREYTDFHSHILPGVDDGIQTMTDALEMLSCLERSGVKTVWLTPHILEKFPNTTHNLQQRFQKLTSAYSGSMQLHLAAEYRLDSLFMERFEADDLLALDIKGARGLLIEISCFRPPMDFHAILKRMKAKGYYPVLAHAERFLHLSDRDYAELKAIGVKFQLNLFSLVGGYGPSVERRAEWLLRNGMYDLLGTDVHRMEQLVEYQQRKLSSKAVRMLEKIKAVSA